MEPSDERSWSPWRPEETTWGSRRRDHFRTSSDYAWMDGMGLGASGS